MSGRIDETYLSKLKERKLSDQSEIDDFTEEKTTYIGVVSEPINGMQDVVDEVIPELGMPEDALYEFLERRSGYRKNSAVDFPHNKAYEDVGLHGIYQNYIAENNAAQRRLHELVERVGSGENITLVCYESGGEKCHRNILVNILKERVQSREDCKFELSA